VITAQGSLVARLWTYQAERFPILRNGMLIAVFASSGVTLSAVLAHRTLPGLAAYGCAAFVAFGLFFQLRVADEVKDADDDRRYRPERPVPRGLVTLRLLVCLALLVALLQAVATALYSPRLLALLLVVWAWMGLMAVEFFVPGWLRARPLAYLVSHMVVMPLIDLWITGVEWLPRSGVPPFGLLPALLLSFANGCVLEIGRKTWAPESERPGVETYSSLWGPRTAARCWLATLTAAGCLVWLTGASAGASWPMAAIAIIAFALTSPAARAFIAHPTLSAQHRLDNSAGLWVLTSYATLGLVPLLMRGVR
jgi:4-hydroxybenzoate polyprenyltransferase